MSAGRALPPAKQEANEECHPCPGQHCFFFFFFFFFLFKSGSQCKHSTVLHSCTLTEQSLCTVPYSTVVYCTSTT